MGVRLGGQARRPGLTRAERAARRNVLAANPRDPAHLVGGAIVFDSSAGAAAAARSFRVIVGAGNIGAPSFLWRDSTGRPRVPPVRPQRASGVVTGNLEVVFEPPEYDPVTATRTMPIRLRNRSARPLYAPIRMRVLRFGSGNLWTEFVPAILNAGAQEDGPLLRWTIRGAGDAQRLDAGAVSGAVDGASCQSRPGDPTGRSR